MALNKIKTGSITDDAVNSDKLGPGSVTSTELNTTAITGQTELSETANDADFTIIFDTSANALKKVLRSNLKQANPTISSITPTNATNSGTQTFTITGTGFTVGSNARFIDNNGKIVEFNTVTRNSTTQITATITGTSLSIDVDPYDVQVTNGEGLSTVLTNQVNINAVPTFTTASGSLGTIADDSRTGVRLTVNATDPDSAGNVTFELQSGSLPAGLSLSSEGSEGGTAVISGNATAVSSDTTSNFVLRAVDAASNTSSRSFSITIEAPTFKIFNASGTFAVPTGTTSVSEVLVVGGGGGGGEQHGGGGGAGGLIYFPNYPVTPGGTITVTVGDGGGGGGPSPSGASPGCRGNGGQNTVFGSPGDPGLGQGGVLTARGGGGGGTYQCTTGSPGGSGGGSSGGGGGPGGQTTQPTQPGNSGAYGFGSQGGVGHPQYAGGGGGGAGAIGSCGSGSPGNGGDGGVGKAYTIADGTTSVYYAGGGGGGSHQNPTPADKGGNGGQGGGGHGGSTPAGPNAGDPGQANKGGGGGGSGNGGVQAGDGGKGIVIVRY